MISKFNNEVLSKGPNAVLPQNLDRPWLERLQKIAEEFLDKNFSTDKCKEPQDAADPLLSVCVFEILRHHQVKADNVSPEEMIQKMAIYAISIVMEAVSRETDIGLEPPNLDNILSIERIEGYKKINPEFKKLLEQACVFQAPGKR